MLAPSGHGGEGAEGHGEAEPDDHEGADGREGAHERALEARAVEHATRADREEADAGDHGCEPDAEGDDEQEPVADAMQGDRRQQDDERRRTGQ